VRILVAASLLIGAGAHASVFDTYGFGSRSAAMGNAHAAAAEDYTGVFYNPGTLTVRKRPHLGLGVNLVAPNLSAEAQPRDRGPDIDLAPEPITPRTNVGVHLGLLFPLGGLIDNRFALGLGVYVPTIQVTRVESFDPVTPHFYRYDALPDKINLALGAAFELHPTISLGLGYQYLGTLTGNAQIDLDLLTRRFTRKDVDVDIQGRGGLTAGVLIRPLDALRIGLSYRSALAVEYVLDVDINLVGIGSLVVDIDGVALYTPEQYTLGAAWQGETWTLTGDLIWSRWSAAPDPSPHFTVTLDGADIGLGAIVADAEPVDLGAEDTLEARIGTEWAVQRNLWLRAGYGIRPTPLPSQTGFTNYLDSDAHIVGLGVGYSMPDPLERWDSPVVFELTVQGTILEERRHEKAPDRAYGSYAAGGTIWHLAFTSRHDF
jgi:long-chain fatty acid transport protein